MTLSRRAFLDRGAFWHLRPAAGGFRSDLFRQYFHDVALWISDFDDDGVTFFLLISVNLVLTVGVGGSYKAFIDGGVASELAAGAVMFCFFVCLAG